MKRLILWLITPLLIFSFSLLASCSKEEVREEPLPPEITLAEADALIADDEFDKAREMLNEIKGRDTTRKYAPIAQLKIAESYEKSGELEVAESEYKRFIEQYPDSQYAPYAQYQIAMIYFTRIKGPQQGAGEAKRALEAFRQLKALYPRNPYKELIDINIKKCLNTIADYEFIVGKFYFKKGSYNAALGRFLGILRNYPHYKATDEVLSYIVQAYIKSGELEKARNYMDHLEERFHDSRFIEDLTEELAEYESSNDG